jgi:hypothetical protein
MTDSAENRMAVALAELSEHERKGDYEGGRTMLLARRQRALSEGNTEEAIQLTVVLLSLLHLCRAHDEALKECEWLQRLPGGHLRGLTGAATQLAALGRTTEEEAILREVVGDVALAPNERHLILARLGVLVFPNDQIAAGDYLRMSYACALDNKLEAHEWDYELAPLLVKMGDPLARQYVRTLFEKAREAQIDVIADALQPFV